MTTISFFNDHELVMNKHCIPFFCNIYHNNALTLNPTIIPPVLPYLKTETLNLEITSTSHHWHCDTYFLLDKLFLGW